jgi:VIT1/CCC1 family predicted Fe2+/Mn2+ transporter
MANESLKALLDSLQNEREAVMLYNQLAVNEKDPRLAEVYRRMSAAEQRHVDALVCRLAELGVGVPAFKRSWRIRSLTWLSRLFGQGVILSAMQITENQNIRKYETRPEEAEMAAEESSHARLLKQIGQASQLGMEGGRLASIEGRHRSAGGNALRAAVLGANDGLVSNLSLVMGVAGAELSNDAILITGLAGLLAGAFSMALGEWLSVQSSRELYQHQLSIERNEIAAAPQEEAEELSLIYQARGIPEAQARQMAMKIMKDQDSALDALAREELSVDPQELGGSAWEAALTSFILFALGAVVPVISFLFLSGLPAIAVSLVLSALGLFILGAGITLFTGRNVFYSGLRQVLFGLMAAAVTFGIGRLIGVNLAG